MNYFDNSNIKLDILKKKAYNLRWAEVADGTIPVSYTHLDVYKRQDLHHSFSPQ